MAPAQEALYSRIADGAIWYAQEGTRPNCEGNDPANCIFEGISHRGGMAQRECVGCCYTESTAPNVDRCEHHRWPYERANRCQQLTDRRCVACSAPVCAEHVGSSGRCVKCVVGNLPEEI